MNETSLIRPTEEAQPAPTRLPGPPRLGLMGEFSAGKTTLINFLLGDEVLPTRVTATQMPPVWLSYGPRAAHYVTTDGERRDIDFEEIGAVEVEGVRYVKITCEAEILHDFDLIDTPGISDPNIPDAYRQAVIDFVDGVIWCTHAPQAWRESERSAWVAMPDRLFASSILLATRSDKLADKDRARVEARLRHEAGSLFGEIIMFSTMDAIRACEMEGGEALFAASGAERLVAALHEVANGIAGSAAVAPEPEPASAVIVPLPPASVRPARVSRAAGSERQRLSPEAAGAMEHDLRGPAVEPTPIRRRPEPAAVAPEADVEESAAPEVLAEDAGIEVAAAPEMDADEAATDIADVGGAEEVSDESLTADQDIAAQEEAEELALAEAIELDMPEEVEAVEPAPLPVAETVIDAAEGEEDVLDLSAFRIDDENEGDAPAIEEAEEPSDVDVGAFSALLADIGRSVEAHEVTVAPEHLPGSTSPPLSVRAIWEEIAGRDDVVTTTDLIVAIGDLLERLEREGRIAAPQGAMDFGRGEG
ncbi:dynamin family protein [Frigidibacter sp. RF13]|uniref:dynamin family protein n=1 Tax=Frigidibacter sp. RF13 TaxID=2997340 RepID=UPI00227069F4|nr:dynamin family protein [Frigidibacter sp. RF13]MCY1128263.1 dynamin family protein [Frigidibacter sp. RF13]